MKWLEDNPENVKPLVDKELEKGFIWIDELVNSLFVYEKNRNKYPTLRSYMPEIVKLQNSLSPKEIYKKFEKNCPAIIGTNIKNGAKNINPSITEIVVMFDKPMYPDALGTSYGKKAEDDYIPNFTDYYWKNDKELVLKVTLLPNKEYSVSFPNNFFYSADFYNPKNTYFLDFKTGKVKK